MLNGLSYLISLNMIAVCVPGITPLIMSVILQITYLDILQTGSWLDIYLANFSNQNDALSPLFNDQGYGSMNMFLNLGSTLVFLFLAFLILVLSVMFNLCKGKMERYINYDVEIIVHFIVQILQDIIRE